MSSRELSEWMAFFQIEREDSEDKKMSNDLSSDAAAGLKKRIDRQRGR